MRIFISHSSKDIEIVKAIVELLKKALSLSGDSIRCSSLDGYKYMLSDSVNSKIKEEIIESELVIALITNNSLKSYYFLFELGGRWAVEKPLIPILFDHIDIRDISPLLDTVCLIPTNHAQIYKLLEDVSNILKLELEKASSLTRDVNEVMNIIDSMCKINSVGLDDDGQQELDVLRELSRMEHNINGEVFLKDLENKVTFKGDVLNEIVRRLIVQGFVDHMSDSRNHIGITSLGMNHIREIKKGS